MAASETFYGEGHEATFTEQPAPTTRRAQLSEIAHGTGPHGFTAPVHVELSEQHDHNPDA